MPAEHAVKLVLAGDQDGGITGAARREFARDFGAGDFFGGVEDFEDGKAAAIADVEGFAGDGFDGFESADVGIGDVEYVDVIADASAVGRRVIGTEDFEMRNDAESGVENFGDEMSFDAMGFAALDRSAGGVEIAKSGVMEAGVGTIVGEYFLEAELGFAIGIDGIFGVVFGDGNGVRLAVRGGGGRENEFIHAVTNNYIEQIDPASDIGGIEGAGFTDGFGDERFTRKMHDGFDFVL